MRRPVLSLVLVVGSLFVPSAHAALIVSPAPVDGIAGTTLFAVDRRHPVDVGLPTIAKFSDDSFDGVCRASSYRPTVRWGGHGQGPFALIRAHPPQTTTPKTCTYDVLANYLYFRPGAYTVSVRVCRTTDNVCADTVRQEARIRAPRYTAMELDETVAAGAPFETPLAVLRDNNRFGTPDQFATSIDWGDQSPPEAGRLAGVRGAWAVLGSHTFQTGGPHDVRIDIRRATPAPAPRVPDLSKSLTYGGEPIFPAAQALVSVTSHVSAQGAGALRGRAARAPMRMAVRSARRGVVAFRLLHAPAQLQYGLVVELLRPGGARVARTLLELPAHGADAALPLRWRLGTTPRRGRYVLRVPRRPGFPAVATSLTLR